MASRTDAVPAPTIIVDEVHVTYRVYASGKRLDRSGRTVGRQGRRSLREVRAVKGVSFVAHEGEVIGVIGHNGSGKSTLFRAMTGLLPVTTGRIWAQGRPTLLGVNAALIDELSGSQNVILGLLGMGMSRAEAVELHDSVAEFAGVEEFIDLPMRTYSAGMAARLKFAIATARPHSILLVDEALNVGDKQFKEKSEARIEALRASASTVMVVSHALGSIIDMCTRVIWIDHGTVRMDGEPDEVVAAYRAQ